MVKQTKVAAQDFLNGDVFNDSMSSMIGVNIDFQIEKKIDVKTQFQGSQNSQFNIILFNSCLYIRYFDGLYIYRPETFYN